MKQQLEGINEKIKRANECICNLDREINSFFSDSKYPVIPNQDDQMFKVVADYHLDRPIPLRFSVLAGEIVHHLRSCYDHLIWHFSDASYRNTHCNLIEFPVFDVKPVSKDELPRYERKIKGVSNAQVKALIQAFQPYNVPPPRESPLFIIHNMDRFDKHRELVIVFPALARKLGAKAFRALMNYEKAKSPGTRIEYDRAVNVDSEITPHVAFRPFGEREYVSVVPALQELTDYTGLVVEAFEKFVK
jgi:hypothetical protein